LAPWIKGTLDARHAAVFLAENAIAANEPGAVLDRIDVLRSIAFEAARSPESRHDSRRCVMCLADADGEWKELLRKFSAGMN